MFACEAEGGGGLYPCTRIGLKDRIDEQHIWYCGGCLLTCLLQSVPKVRVYFEKVAGGFEPDPIISNWDIFDE